MLSKAKLRQRPARMRRGLAAAMAAALTLGAAACGGQSDGGGGEKVSLTFWHGFTEADGKVINRMVDEFNASQSEVHITTQVNPWDVIADKLLPAISAKQGPDIVAQPTTAAVTYAKKGAFQPLDGFYDDKANETDTYVSGAVDASTVDGKKYGVPLAFGPVCLYYNKTLFAQRGITKPPTTWAEWVETARKLTIDRNGDGTPEQYGLAMSSHGRLSPIVWASLLRSNGGGVVADGKSVLDKPENAKTLQFWQDAVKQHKIMPPSVDDNAASDLYASQKAAMHVSGVWMALRSKGSKIDYGIAPLPAGPVEQTTGANALSMYMTAQADDKKVEAAEKFFAYFNGKDRQIERSLASGWPPSRTDIEPSDLKKNPDVATFAALTKNAEVGFDGVSDFEGVRTEFGTVTQKALNGADVASILREGQSRIQTKLDAR